MALALEMLGYQHCAHGFDMMDGTGYAQHLEKAVDAHFFDHGPKFTREDWDSLLGHCGAITDMPLVGFWRELCEAYPEAKVVLVERSEDTWYKSLLEAVVEPFFTPSSNLTRLYLEPLLGSRLGDIAFKAVTGFLGASDEASIKANMRTRYRQHYKDIQASIAPERLLEYDLKDGWEPLCQFLGKPVPEAGFPRVNETDAVKEVFKAYKRKRLAELGHAIFSELIPAALFLVAMILTVTRIC